MPSIDRDMLEKAAAKVFDRLNYFNDYTLQTIGRRIKNIGKLSAYDQQTLKNMADISGDMKAITKKLAEITGQNIEEIEKIYAQTISDGVNTYKPLYDFRGMELVPFEQNEFAQRLVTHWARQTAGEMINLSRTKALCFDKTDIYGNVIGSTPLAGAFQNAMDEAVAAISSGTVDFNAAMAKTIERLGGSGVKVTYGSGVNRSLSSMVRQNLLYGAKQSARAYDEYIGAKLGCDGFEVDAHAGCRPSHMFMQGKMYSYHGRKVIDGVAYEDGEEALDRLNDYNCLHFKTDVILGVSEPRYSKKELDRIRRESTELIEYDGRKKTLYEWKQTQRRIERGVRCEQQKANMFKAAGNNIKAQDCNARVKAYRQKYDDMCEKVGLTPKYERMRTYMGSSAKMVDNGGKSGIIKENSKKNITVISDKAIEKVPKVEISEYSDEQNAFIQQQHKELLKYAKDNNDSKEVAFVFREDMSDRSEFFGDDNSLDFESGLSGKGSNLFVMHNHPRNSGYSDRDIMLFLQNDDIKTITIVKNNGTVETLTKIAAYDKQKAITELSRQYKKNVKNGNDEEISKAIIGFLDKYKEGMEWKK